MALPSLLEYSGRWLSEGTAGCDFGARDAGRLDHRVLGADHSRPRPGEPSRSNALRPSRAREVRGISNGPAAASAGMGRGDDL